MGRGSSCYTTGRAARKTRQKQVFIHTPNKPSMKLPTTGLQSMITAPLHIPASSTGNPGAISLVLRKRCSRSSQGHIITELCLIPTTVNAFKAHNMIRQNVSHTHTLSISLSFSRHLQLERSPSQRTHVATKPLDAPWFRCP